MIFMNIKSNLRPTILSILICISLMSGTTSVVLSSMPNPTEQQRVLINTTSETWKLCIGAIMGLLGGGLYSNGKDRSESKK